MDFQNWHWIRPPKSFAVHSHQIEVMTEPHTDLWQRTYYHFRNDNAPLFQTKSDEKYFSFVVKTEFDSRVRFDQSGVVMYLNSENWLKASVEYENERIQRLGCVVTNLGYSDWSSVDIDAAIRSVWFRLSRRESDFCVECSYDGRLFQQMRICHMFCAVDTVQFGVYACSPENSSFRAVFTEFETSDSPSPATTTSPWT